MINMKGNTLVINTIKWSFVAGSIALLSACNDSDSKNKRPLIADIEKTEIGVWSAPAYGWVIDIQNSSYKFYQTTSQYCHEFKLDESTLSYDSLINSIALSDDKDSLISTIGGIKTPGVEMTRALSLPKNCIDNVLKQQGEEGYVFNPEQDFEIFWQNYKEHYAFFHIENVNWDEIYQTFVTQVSATTSQEELFEVFAQMIAPLKDFHVGIENEKIDEEFSVSRKLEMQDIALAEYLEMNDLDDIDTQAQFLDFIDYYEQQFAIMIATIGSYLVQDDDVKLNETETLIWSKTPDNFGYLYIESMELAEIIEHGDTQADKLALLELQLTEIFTDLKDTQGLMIDVRFNGGGDDFVSQKVMSYLIENKIHAYSKQARLGDARTELQKVEIHPRENFLYSMPIALLTSADTSSAAEIFSIAIRARDNSVLIGQSTGGGLSDILPKSLPHGLQYSISNEFYISHDGLEFEGSGVPVAIEKPFFTLEQRTQEKDLIIEAAIEWLQSQS
ncbi:S41 family peptidase [Pseudoalteromonas sp. C2R02]|uniref:S41 family peptidase n=1 Tax=Pseudoalteromonas sp. C2R02 TaxID=2841565 RepID=UPI001C080F4B|nr:S41 family peptidase [Pseudoalteromonas sp. C2R02]MBU2972451.1 S41 family peptidase [Pseudoalteromonas sp. C2R02]